MWRLEMSFIKKIQQILAADIIDIKPQLKEKKAADKQAKLQPRFDLAKMRVLTSNTYAYKYELEVNVPVPALYVRDKKKNNMREFTSQLHKLLDDKIGIWMGSPSLGGMRDRAKGGMLNIQAKWYFNDAYLAYALGLDLTKWHGSEDVVEKSKISARQHLAEKAMKEMDNYKSVALKKLKLRSQDEEEQNKIWKEEYMKDWTKLIDKWEEKGISYSQLKQSEQEKKQAFGYVQKIEERL